MAIASVSSSLNSLQTNYSQDVKSPRMTQEMKQAEVEKKTSEVEAKRKEAEPVPPKPVTNALGQRTGSIINVSA